jgi:hypothetical protein
MKKLIVVILVFISVGANAQKLIGGDHILKTNLSSDALKNYNLTFEKNILPFVSLSASYRTMPKTALPLKSLAKQFIKSDDINFDNFQVGNTALTFEGRFYLGIQKMSGFYIAPYTRFANFDLSIPVNYSYNSISTTTLQPIVENKTATLEGTIRSQSVGIYVGMQFQLATKLVLDFWMIGGHYGTSNGKLEFTPLPGAKFPAEAQAALQKNLNNINANPFKVKATVTSTGAIADMEGPWAGIRGAGLTLGLRF